mmetsp:Transcript_30042/g.87247  ORF Transcript_30042/g.87247 Transcript_30042/m.87247 type:complete len:112 (+) Transcript_30042:204-539(+)
MSRLYAPTAFLLHRQRSYADALRWCYDGCAGNRVCETLCVEGVGMQTFKENLDDLQLVGRVCAQAKSDALALSCVRGAFAYYEFAKGCKVPADLCNQFDSQAFRRACLRGQ